MTFNRSTLLVSLSVMSCALLFSSCSLFDTEQIANNQDTNVNPNTAQTSEVNQIAVNQNADPLQSSIDFQRQYQTKRSEHLGTSRSPEQTEQQAQLQNLLTQQRVQDSTQRDINYYVRGMMQDLVANLEYVNSTTPVAVTSFVMLDSNYNQANILGIQIAESLIHEVHKFGIPVIDFKTTGYIRVTEQGDFAFSKDYEDLSEEMPARYIVGGTMLKNTHGYLLNARIVGLQSQAVVASAQSLIPNHIAEPILDRAVNHSHAPSKQNTSLNLRMNDSDLSKDKMVQASSANRISLVQE